MKMGSSTTTTHTISASAAGTIADGSAPSARAANGKRPHAVNSPSRRGIQPSQPRTAAVSEPANGHPDSAFNPEQVLAGLISLKKGDFAVRLPLGWTGISGKVADTFNEVAEMLSHSTDELSRISRVVGRDGRIQERMAVGHAPGDWSERVKSVNALID